jgi:hypothetical protein
LDAGRAENYRMRPNGPAIDFAPRPNSPVRSKAPVLHQSSTAEEDHMNRTSIAAAIAVGAWISLGSPASSKVETDQRFGTGHFATSCNETAQRRFDRAMRYQHSFWYQASKELFEEVLKADPGRAIAYWGIALSLLYNPHAPPPPANLPLGLTALQKGQAVGARSQRERDYIDALTVFYTDYDKVHMPRACKPISMPWKRSRRNIPTTAKRRSSTPSRSM